MYAVRRVGAPKSNIKPSRAGRQRAAEAIATQNSTWNVFCVAVWPNKDCEIQGKKNISHQRRIFG